MHYHLYDLLFSFPCPKSFLGTHLLKSHWSPESYRSHNSLCHLTQIIELFNTLIVNVFQENKTKQNVIYILHIYEDVLRGIGRCDYRG